MELVKQVTGDAGWCLGFQPDGRELLVVAAKVTFDLPLDGAEPTVAKEQVPLTKGDEFTGPPGLSATRYESDYAHRKPFCDVLVNGLAYAPHGEPTERVTVGLYAGPIQKRFEVVGDRVWDKVLFLVRPSLPIRFTTLAISYDRAYGGTDKSETNPSKVKTYVHNPVGVGY